MSRHGRRWGAAALIALAAFFARQALATACVTDADCGGTTPICGVNSACRACQGDLECTTKSPTTPACDGAEAGALAGACTQCSSTNGTLCSAPKPVCVVSAGACGCAQDQDCGNPNEVCDRMMGAGGTCIMGCRVLAMGDTCPMYQYCQVADGGMLGTCQPGCKFPTDCGGAAPVCDTNAHNCVQCLMSSDCVGGNVCETTPGPTFERCVECTAGNTSNCDPTMKGSACLPTDACGCMADADCGGATSGRICEPPGAERCQPGCRGTGGNGCPSNQVCSSTTGQAGTCMFRPPADGGAPAGHDAGADAASPGDGGTAGGGSSGGGCGCSLWPRGSAAEAAGTLAVLLALGTMTARRKPGSPRRRR